MNQIEEFKSEVNKNIADAGKAPELKALGVDFINKTAPTKYSYNFSWLGRPIIQFPQDMIAMQELIWEIQPDLIIETGVAHGGSLIYYASLLELLGKGQVLGVDIDIRKHNRKAIEEHKMSHRIKMLQGSSTDSRTFAAVAEIASNAKAVLVILDSNHTHDHVKKELALYSQLVSINSYCVVFDTVIEDMPADAFPDRAWGPGNNPKTAVHEFLKLNHNFQIDASIQNKLLITVAPDGYLKRVL